MMDNNILKILSQISEEEKNILNGNAKINRNLYMTSNTNIINSKKLLEQGKLITIRPHTRFIHFPVHTHDYVEVVYMLTGSTTHIINGNELLLYESELLFLNQNSKQEILPAGEKDIAINFIILPEFFDNSLVMINENETPLKEFLIGCLRNSDSTIPYLHFKIKDVLPIQNLIENLLWTLINETPNKRRINQTTMGLIFLLLINQTDKLSYNDNEKLIFKVLSYVEEHYKNGSLTELTTMLNYDFNWLSKEIKRKTGKTYTELVQKKRLSQAAFMMKSTNMNIFDIALSVGYENVSYFHRIFSNEYGMSPRKYRLSK